MSGTGPVEAAEPGLGVDKDASMKSRSRKTSVSRPGDSGPSASPGTPTSFWLATGEDVDRHLLPESSLNDPTSKTTSSLEDDNSADNQHDTVKGPTIGRNLHEALSQVFPKLDSHGNVPGFRNFPNIAPPPPYQHVPSHSNTVSQPLTPLQGASPMVMDWGSALPSTPKSGSLHSLRLSDVDSPIDVEEDTLEDRIRSSLAESEPPQLIMPSLSMPDRRPITDKGRSMGNLRVCVAGAQGSGKTSLIRAVVQQCEDIVHIDTTSTPTSPSASTKTLSKSAFKADMPGIVEIMASTKCYPSWWNDMEESRILKRRKSGGDTILERNLCFIDTPGFDTVDDYSKAEIFKYIEHNFLHIDTPADFSDLERLNLVSGRGGSLVDVILFIFSDASNFENELSVFLELCSLTNTIPIIGKCDLLDKNQLLSRKMEILDRLQSSSRPFLFGRSATDLFDKMSKSMNESASMNESVELEPQAENTQHENNIPSQTAKTQSQTPMSSLYLSKPASENHPPYAISTLPGSDSSEMDASLLMSESYSPPLHASDLSELVNRLFDPENMSWMKHTAGRKYLTWRKGRMASKNESGTLVPHEGRNRSSKYHQHNGDQGFSFTSRFRGYATTSASNLMREASLGNSDEHTRKLLEKLCSEVKKGTINALDNQGVVDAKRKSPLSLPSSESSTVTESTTIGASALTSRRRNSRTTPRSHYIPETRELELPEWSRPKQPRSVRSGGHSTKQDKIIKSELRRRQDFRRKQQQRLHHIRAGDPLGIVAAWEEWGKALVWGAGGGVLVGVVVVLGRWWFAGTNTELR